MIKYMRPARWNMWAKKTDHQNRATGNWYEVQGPKHTNRVLHFQPRRGKNMQWRVAQWETV